MSNQYNIVNDKADLELTQELTHLTRKLGIPDDQAPFVARIGANVVRGLLDNWMQRLTTSGIEAMAEKMQQQTKRAEKAEKQLSAALSVLATEAKQ